VDRSVRDVGRLRREPIWLLWLWELALAKVWVAEGGIRVMLWLLVDRMGQKIAVSAIWRHVHKGSVIEWMQSRRDDAMATETKLVLGHVAVV
jgi:hypothetical protein